MCSGAKPSFCKINVHTIKLQYLTGKDNMRMPCSLGKGGGGPGDLHPLRPPDGTRYVQRGQAFFLRDCIHTIILQYLQVLNRNRYMHCSSLCCLNPNCTGEGGGGFWWFPPPQDPYGTRYVQRSHLSARLGTCNKTLSIYRYRSMPCSFSCCLNPNCRGGGGGSGNLHPIRSPDGTHFVKRGQVFFL